MHSQLAIQTPTPQDYPELTQVWEDSVRATHDFLPQSYIAQLRELVLTRYLDAVMLVCCKDHHQRISGFAGISPGRVEMLFIAPRYRGQGLGKHLLQHAIHRRNACELDVNEQNTQAVGFYFKQGFEVIGRSEHDGMKQPYPLLHLKLKSATNRMLPG